MINRSWEWRFGSWWISTRIGFQVIGIYLWRS